jgi:hypothetical protein
MSEAKVGETKENATDPIGAKRQPPRPSAPEETEQLQFVVTLSAPNGEVIKVEKIERPGHRRELSEEEFAELAGEDEVEELGAALEEAYAAGINDAMGEDDEDEDEDEEEEEIALRRFILGRAAGRQLLRRGVRRLILRRALQRELARRRPRAATKTGNGRRKA